MDLLQFNQGEVFSGRVEAGGLPGELAGGGNGNSGGRGGIWKVGGGGEGGGGGGVNPGSGGKGIGGSGGNGGNGGKGNDGGGGGEGVNPGIGKNGGSGGIGKGNDGGGGGVKNGIGGKGINGDGGGVNPGIGGRGINGGGEKNGIGNDGGVSPGIGGRKTFEGIKLFLEPNLRSPGAAPSVHLLGCFRGLKARSPAENTWSPCLFDLRRSDDEMPKDTARQPGSPLLISFTAQPSIPSASLPIEAGKRTLNLPCLFVLASCRKLRLELEFPHSIETYAPEMK